MSTIKPEQSSQDWEAWWDARLAALEAAFGKSDDQLLHGLVPFHMGHEHGGAADVLIFRQALPGVLYVSADLIGCVDGGHEDLRQLPNELGNYELAIAVRQEVDWAPRLISLLAYYTLETTLEPGDTMDVGPALPPKSSISALRFYDYARFTVLGQAAGVLLGMGITDDELAECQAGRSERVDAELRAQGVFPFSDPQRRSVLER